MNELIPIKGSRDSLEQQFLESLFRGERDIGLADRLKPRISREDLAVISGSGSQSAPKSSILTTPE
jgi:hypothetical protein